jgi:Aerotolerance regulator N-terminal
MLIFASSAWLWVAAASALVGGWAIWRGQRRARAVSSVKLWQGLGGSGNQTRRRAVDPLWMLILGAALIAAVGLAQPQWRFEDSPSQRTLPVEWSIRSIKSHSANGRETDRTDAWLHLSESAACPASLILNANGQPRKLTPADLHRGLALRINNAGERVTLSLQAEGQVLAQQTFVIAPGTGSPPFRLLERSVPDGNIDAALSRVFTLQAKGRPEDSSIHSVVLLINTPDFVPSSIPDGGLVVAQPDTPLPGLTLGSRIDAPAQGWMVTPSMNESIPAFAWPSFVRLDEVRIKSMRQITLSNDWHVLATANNQPWIAARKWEDPAGTARPSTLIWLASEPSTQTNWPAFPSFVAFFAEMTSRTFSSFAGAASGSEQIIAWNPIEKPQSQPPNPPLVIDLSRLAGAIALSLIGTAVAWFVWRNRVKGERHA